MLAIFIGDIFLLFGLAVLLLPLIVTELSRPRDSLWGAVVLLFGWVLVSTHDRWDGSLSIAFASATLLIARLSAEVARSRWQNLSNEEKKLLVSSQRWIKSLNQFWVTIVMALGILGGFITSLVPKDKKNKIQKKWIRPDPSESNETIQKEKNSIDEDIDKEKKEKFSPSALKNSEHKSSKNNL